MANNKKKYLTPAQRAYQQFAQEHLPRRPVIQNCLRAFFVGGVLSLFGEALRELYLFYFILPSSVAGYFAAGTIIFLTLLLTGFGVYDHFSPFSGAGLFTSITGFANAVISCCIEHRQEGWVDGIGSNAFKLVGSVLLVGWFSSFLVLLFEMIWTKWSGF